MYLSMIPYNTEVNFLILDTSGKSSVLGLMHGGHLLDRTSSSVETHSRKILPSIEQILREAKLALDDLDAIILGQGPGSFTGLRISAGVAQGLGYGLQIPVVPVSSMAAIAQAAAETNAASQVFVALHARLEEIYFGAYKVEGEQLLPMMAEGVLDASRLPRLSEGNWLATGNASELWEKIQAATGVTFNSILENAQPSATALLTLGKQKFLAGETVKAEDVAPIYLREVVARKS